MTATIYKKDGTGMIMGGEKCSLQLPKQETKWNP